MARSEHPYASFIHRVKRPAQYLGGEQGEMKRDFGAAKCTICLAFPDLYEIGMSHLGYKILYGVLNRHPKLVAERAYAVWPDMEAELRHRNEPLRSLESWRPLADFDVVGFSLQYELTYTNVLQMLELGGIPLRSADRGEDDPLVVAGGPCATHAETMSPFVDVFLIGDGEEKTPELMLTWAHLKSAGLPRGARLEELAALGGFYVPSLYAREIDETTGFYVVTGASEAESEAPFPIERAFLADLDAHPFPADGPVAATPTIFDRVSVEIARGCTEGCRFCQAGMIYRPVRERDPQHVIDVIKRAVEHGGYDEASLTSLSTADYSAIAPLVRRTLEAVGDRKVDLSVSSLRAYGLSEQVLDDMATQSAKGLTFAPEAGTQRMRDVVNKNVTEEQLLETAERVFSRGWERMKLYFMIGLPTEEDDDVRGIVDTGARALEVARRVRGDKRAKVTVSVSTHVPKPHTPFQWCAMDPHEEVVRKQRILEERARGTAVMLRMHDSEGSWLEGVLARGDRRVGEAIERAYRLGARFDSWDDQLRLHLWREAFEEAGIDTAIFLGTIPVDARLPWDHIDVGLEEGFLEKEYRKALKSRLSPPCGKAVGAFVHATHTREAEADRRRLVCYDCGIACDMSKMRETRIDFLEKLDAEEPLGKIALPLHRQKSPPRRGAEAEGRTVDRRPMRDVDQGPKLRLRLQFRKVGRIAFSSHLDLVRVFPRIFRRAGLPLYYSEGFSPAPQMTFSQALSLGIASVAEYVDVKLRARDLQEGELDSIVDRLNELTVDGIEFVAHRVLDPMDPAINRVIDRAVYVAGLPRATLDAAGVRDAAALSRRVEERLGADRLEVVRRVKGIGKRIDVRAGLDSVNVDAGGAVLEEAGLRGELLPIRMTIRIGQNGTVKATEALTALLDLPEDEAFARIVREALLGERDGVIHDPMTMPPAPPKKRAPEGPETAPMRASGVGP